MEAILRRLHCTYSSTPIDIRFNIKASSTWEAAYLLQSRLSRFSSVSLFICEYPPPPPPVQFYCQIRLADRICVCNYSMYICCLLQASCYIPPHPHPVPSSSLFPFLLSVISFDLAHPLPSILTMF